MPVAKQPGPSTSDLVQPIFDAQTRLIEAAESALRSNDSEEFDMLLAEATRKIASARSAGRELQRVKLGLVTIAETG